DDAQQLLGQLELAGERAQPLLGHEQRAQARHRHLADELGDEPAALAARRLSGRLFGVERLVVQGRPHGYSSRLQCCGLACITGKRTRMFSWETRPAMFRAISMKAFASADSGFPTTTGTPRSPPTRTFGSSGTSPRKEMPNISAAFRPPPRSKISLSFP